jgi:hypothetical protein
MFSGGLCRRLAVAVLLLLAAGGAGAQDRRFTGDLARLRHADDTAPIEASLYSLSSAFFDAGEASALLAAVRAHAPARRLLVVCDSRMCDELGESARALDLTLLPSALSFTPWPRDPLSFARAGNGDPVVIGRPNPQPGREADAELAGYLAGALPRLDPRWRGIRHAVAPLPFHGGQMLAVGDSLWLSLHSVEPRALARLALTQVPVESFGEPAGVERYAAAAAAAARELGAFFHRRAEFVHPLPAGADDPAAPELAWNLAGGAGVDLDSYLTVLPSSRRPGIALVGDLRLGSRLLAESRADELAQLAATYDLALGGEALRSALIAAQDERRGRSLAAYLELVAAHLAARGLAVHRLPLLRIPTALLVSRAGFTHQDFLLTWNNVVLERRAQGLQAEGFASTWTPGDRLASRIFAGAGARLRLVPPLVHSIVLNGGYRCASNHLRRAE